MSFFSKFVAPYRKGEKNFERGRAAELRGDFGKAEEYFRVGAEGFDAHFAKGGVSKPSHLVMAGICYTRIGRNEDALDVLDRAMGAKDIPDAFLHAGYAAARLGDRDAAVRYWSGYPAWADQRFIAETLKEQIAALQGGSDVEAVCEAVAKAVHRQDRENAKKKHMTHDNQKIAPKRGY